MSGLPSTCQELGINYLRKRLIKMILLGIFLWAVSHGHGFVALLLVVRWALYVERHTSVVQEID